MFNRATPTLRNFRRATDPQHANIMQRSGPSTNAIVAAVIGVGAGYILWSTKKADDAKPPKHDELKSNEVIRAPGGGGSKI
ncbi:hypothetical protein BX666DRAFT_2027871 [Dichotomocladium elegans]|nr:hypothetical protein BX666DRAFT_2027871 [Dichotomocladium elegans]